MTIDIHALVAEMKFNDQRRLGDDNLYLRTQKGAPSFWAINYGPRPNGKKGNNKLRLGGLEMSLADANRAAIEIKRQIKAGIDPKKARQKIDVPSFGVFAEAYMARHLVDAKNKSSAAKWRGSLTNHCKPIWRLPINEIKRPHIMQVLEPIWKTVPVMASEVRARIETILGSATARGLRFGDNPAKWDGEMKHDLGAPPKRGTVRGPMASVRFEKLPALIAELDCKKIATTRALIAIAMTCVRTQEFLGMRLSELDLDAEQPMWTIPNARFKKALPNNEDFELPLAPQVVRILKEQIAHLEETILKGKVDYLWPSWTLDGQMSNATMLNYLKRSMGLKATVHGFRASFRTWADDQFASGSEVAPKYHHYAIEFCLTHIPGSAVEKSYRRGTFYKARISIMRDWANYLMPPKAADNVIPFKREHADLTEASSTVEEGSLR